MGLIIKGKWGDQWYDTQKSNGAFIRQESQYRHTISDAPDNQYQPESGRYNLYVSLACPWAHRTLIFRQLKSLKQHISVSIVEPEMLDKGWVFADPGDDLYQLKHLFELYLKGDKNYQGRVTVPVLWDKKTETIVNNESSEIIRIFNSAFDGLTGNQEDYYPQHLRSEIDRINSRIYKYINNGVYRAGFATTQAAYEQAHEELFMELDRLEKHLATQRYLVAGQISEADWRLFTTLLRFDAVYHGHFKCNRQKLSELENISAYLRELYQIPGVRETVNINHIKNHYYKSHLNINPTGIVPAGPRLDFSAAHNRELVSLGIN